MRKTLLLLISLIISGVMYAQKSLVVADSSYQTYNYNQAPQLAQTHSYSYNENCLDTLMVSNEFLFDGTQFNANDHYTYNTDGTVETDIYTYFDTILNAYVNSQRRIYTYTQGNLNYKVATDTWKDSSWQPQYLQTNVYASFNKPLLFLDQLWDSSQQAYINANQQVITYETSGHQLDLYSQEWQKIDSTWNTIFEFRSVYDANDFLINDTLKYTDPNTNELSIQSYRGYYNNSTGQVDSSYQVNVSFHDSTRYHCTYYPGSNVVRQTTAYYFFSGRPNGGYRYTYTHDTRPNIITDSSYYEMLVSNTDTAFVLQDLSVVQRFYNPYNQREKYISKDLLYSNGAIVDSSFYIVDSSYAPCSYVLPVTWLAFSAQQKNKDGLLQWQTSHQLNSAYFNVQRSVDGIHFVTIGKVPALQNALATNRYLFTDLDITDLNVKKLYYRLAETSANGTISYSKTAELSISNQLMVSVWPNPVVNAVAIYSPVALSNAVIKITATDGKLLRTWKQNLAIGNNPVLNVSSFSKGIYFVSIQTSTYQQTIKFLKE